MVLNTASTAQVRTEGCGTSVGPDGFTSTRGAVKGHDGRDCELGTAARGPGVHRGQRHEEERGAEGTESTKKKCGGEIQK